MKTRKREKLMFSVHRDASGLFLRPADGYSAKRMTERGYAVGDKLLNDLTKPRNPGFWRLAHKMGTMVLKNVEGYEGLDAHEALKRLQIEGNIACDLIPAFMVIMEQKILVKQRIPISMSYASMDEGEFRGVMRQFCEFIAREYWPSLTPDTIAEMAEAMPEDE